MNINQIDEKLSYIENENDDAGDVREEKARLKIWREVIASIRRAKWKILKTKRKIRRKGKWNPENSKINR